MADHQEYTNDSPNLEYPVDKATAKTYSAFLGNLRKDLTGSKLHDNMLILRSEWEAQGNLYYYVDLSSNRKVLTIAFDVVNLKLTAFKVGNVAYFFTNTTDNKLFRGCEKVELPFTNEYSSLGDRSKVKLGKHALQEAISVLTSDKMKDELKNSLGLSAIKTSIINVMGMVLEATKLMCIEDDITNDFREDILPSLQDIRYEDSWASQLSKDIQRADPGILKYYAPAEANIQE